MININLNILMAAALIAPKADLRYYLNGVYIGAPGVTSTDGHRLFSYDLKETYFDGNENSLNEGFEAFIIPRDSLVQMNRSLTVRERKSAMIKITKDGDHYQMTSGDSIVCFRAIDGNYPNFAKVIPKPYKRGKKQADYNWSYMHDFSKISKMLGNFYGTASLIPNGEDSALVTLPDTNATCVIMPIRSQ